MVHSSRTAFGDSPASYVGNIWAIPMNPLPQGLEQVNRAAPAIWDIVSTLLLNSLREAGFGAAFKCCISREYFSIVGYCFVEESSIIQVSPSPLTPTNKIVKLSQGSLDLFTGSSGATGGQLSALKTKWYLLEFLWYTAGKLRLADHSSNLIIDSRDGRIPI